MNFEYKRIENIYDKYYSFIKSLMWDTKKTYKIDKAVGIDWITDKMVGVYNQTELIALGSIKTFYNLDEKKHYGYLSSIVDYTYRRQGIADHLLKEMLLYCKELGIDIVRVDVLKDNLASVSHIEKSEFDFVSFDDSIITFEKKLINE